MLLLKEKQKGPTFTMAWARCHFQTIAVKGKGIELEVLQLRFSRVVQVHALASVSLVRNA